MSDDASSDHPTAEAVVPEPLRAQSQTATPGAAPAPDATFIAPMVFTGRGGEYFRIWVVNLFLTIVTLGIYSAWAKVRKTKYFWQNTRLDGNVFDFHGNPVAILRGRIVALVLLLAYTWGFEFSVSVGLVTLAVLLLVGPWLFVKAAQFKFGNTSFRGLRFGFAADYAIGYRVLMPILLIWFSSTILTATMAEASSRFAMAIAFVGIATVALIPWMHHRLKAFQHGYATYGDRRFAFAPALRGFYAVYAKGLALMVLGGLVGLLAGGLSTVVLSKLRQSISDTPEWVWVLTGFMSVAAVYVFAWPFLAARLQQLVWAHTRCDGVRFRTEIAAWPLFRLVLRNVALTLVTCGLYWPFASIALARYRVECMRVDADAPLATIAMGTHTDPAVAVGDATADTFGFDIGL